MILDNFKELEKDISENKFQAYLVEGGRASGKSYNTTEILLKNFMKNDYNLLVIKKKGNSIEDTIIPMYKYTIENFESNNMFMFSKRYREFIYKPNGKKIRFISLDDDRFFRPDNFKDDPRWRSSTAFINGDLGKVHIVDYESITDEKLPLIKEFLIWQKFDIDNFSIVIENVPNKNTKELHNIKESKKYFYTYENNNFLPKVYIDRIEKIKKTDLERYKIEYLGIFPKKEL